MRVAARSIVFFTLLGGALAIAFKSVGRSSIAEAPSHGVSETEAAFEQASDGRPQRIDTSTRRTPLSPVRPHARERLLGAGEMQVTGDRLSLDVTDRPLRALLDELYQESGIAFELADELPDSRVSVQFDDLAIDKGVQRLLEGHDSFFLFSPAGGGSSGLISVWVYPRGKGRGLAPIPSPFEPSTDELEQASEGPDLLKRAWATASLIERNGNDASEVVQNALTDPAEQVRLQALHAALHSAVQLSPQLLRKPRSPIPHQPFGR